MPDSDAEITVTQAAEKYGVSNRSIQRAVERGDIPARRIGNLYLLDAEGVRLYAAVHDARRKLADYVADAAAKATA
jgi:excisionase family DNA binding protein